MNWYIFWWKFLSTCFLNCRLQFLKHIFHNFSSCWGNINTGEQVSFVSVSLGRQRLGCNRGKVGMVWVSSDAISWKMFLKINSASSFRWCLKLTKTLFNSCISLIAFAFSSEDSGHSRPSVSVVASLHFLVPVSIYTTRWLSDLQVLRLGDSDISLFLGLGALGLFSKCSFLWYVVSTSVLFSLFYLFLFFFYFTILYWFCHTLSLWAKDDFDGATGCSIDLSAASVQGSAWTILLVSYRNVSQHVLQQLSLLEERVELSGIGHVIFCNLSSYFVMAGYNTLVTAATTQVTTFWIILFSSSEVTWKGGEWG